MGVRAKFRVASIQNANSEGDLKTVEMYPVYSDDPGSENHQYWKWTPAGNINLSTLNPSAYEQFEVGKDYYVDFTPAD